MRKVAHQEVAAVEAELPATVILTWKDGTVERVDLSASIARNRHLAPLADSKLFRNVQVGEWGWSIQWTDELDLSSDQLWRWAGEQAGEFMAPADFQAWRERNGLSLTRAGEALGLSRRMIAYYDSGEKPIPRTVLLATIGYEALRRAA